MTVADTRVTFPMKQNNDNLATQYCQRLEIAVRYHNMMITVNQLLLTHSGPASGNWRP